MIHEAKLANRFSGSCNEVQPQCRDDVVRSFVECRIGL